MHDVIKRLALGVSIGAAMISITTGTAHAQAAAAETAAPVATEKTLFAITFRPGPNWKPGLPFIEQTKIKEHYAYVKGLFRDGHVFAGGGLGKENGLIIFHARDQAEADAVLAADPMIRAGVFLGEVRPFTPAFVSDGPLVVKKG